MRSALARQQKQEKKLITVRNHHLSHMPPNNFFCFNSASGQDVPRRGVPLRGDLGEVHQEAVRVGGEEGNQVSEGASLESIAKPFA